MTAQSLTNPPLVNPDSIPATLKAIPQWVGYQLVPKANGKTDKVPRNPHTRGYAKVSDPQTWGSFDQALELVRQADNVDGVGFVVTKQDQVVGVDIDDCIDEGHLSPTAKAIVELLNSYTEISPSGHGIRIFCLGQLPKGKRKNAATGVEMYQDGRFLTVTGKHLPSTPPTISEASEQLAVVHQRFIATRQRSTSANNRSAPTPPESVVMMEEDERLWAKIFASKNGHKLQRIYNGDISLSDNDRSQAVIDLGNALAWWTNKDPIRIERMMRQTALDKSKWDTRRGESTLIQLQIADCCNYITDTRTQTTRPPAPSTSEVTAVPPLLPTQLPHPLEDADLVRFFLGQGADDEGNAQCVHRLHRDQFVYCPAYGWMQRLDSHWRAGQMAEAQLNLKIIDVLTQRRLWAVQHNDEHGKYEPIVKETKRTNQRKNAVRYLLQDRMMVDVQDFDNEPHLINCKNGVVNLRNGELVAHEPSNRFTYCIDTEYLPEVDTSDWIRFLRSVVGEYDQIEEWLQMAVGYSLTGFVNEECMFYLHGPTRSGKGTFTTALLNLLGSPLSSGISFNSLTAKRDGDSQNFDLAPLKPCRFIAASESNYYQRLNEAVVKQITGQDPITASFKHKDPFSYVPKFKIWLSSNYPVKANEEDEAFWSRIRVVQYSHSFKGREDKHLKERMKSITSRQMILAWCVQGARQWFQAPRGLITPPSVATWTKEHRDELDTVQKWLDECTQRQEGEKTVNHLLYQSYQNWCRENGHTAKFANNFGTSLKAKGFEQTAIKVVGKTHRGYKEIVIID